ncbi:hypothetical protein NUW58_g51 [Xylaria curta]|uniref:Uncharacterized protein n=1 Tax=Xylaria curta TaxID=42375 RepID=A0ACC1PRM2_9PEZI|nr:hypothetical protein NUW58_g51 [Xylaria curta]
MSRCSAQISWDPREPPPPIIPLASYLAAALPDPKWHTESIASAPQGYLENIDIPRRNTIHRAFPSMAIKESNRNVLPAVSVSVKAQITGHIAEVTARQVFLNDADLPIQQGSYTFSLPTGCTVMGFTCRIGNREVLRATARPKGEAQEAFQQAVASHATAALLDQNTPEIFTSSLGNIPPNST